MSRKHIDPTVLLGLLLQGIDVVELETQRLPRVNNDFTVPIEALIAQRDHGVSPHMFASWPHKA